MRVDSISWSTVFIRILWAAPLVSELTSKEKHQLIRENNT